MSRDLLEWAEDHGYMQQHCRRCGNVFWTDSNDGCPNGCFDDEADEPANSTHSTVTE